MALSNYDAPTGSYTSSIPRGTQAFRGYVARRFGFTRTEVVRDKSRCNNSRSEHCECGAIDFFTTNLVLGREVFEWCVRHEQAAGIQSVVFNRRVAGFGDPRERPYTGPSPHTDHVHVGLSRWARANLTATMLAKMDGQEEDALTPEQAARLERVEQGMKMLAVAILTKDDAAAKAAGDFFGVGREESVMDVAKKAQSNATAAAGYAKKAAENTTP